jgi:hypothetical protein
MHDRTALGAADVSHEVLSSIVASALEDPTAELLSSCAEVVPYDLVALTTAGRYRVHGRAVTRDGERPYRLFVKVVQSWSRTPHFAHVPAELRDIALAGLPWEVEPAVYGSDLRSCLPPGLTMPRAYAIRPVDDLSAALWLETVEHVQEPWPLERFAEAARLLGGWRPVRRCDPSRTSGGVQGSRSSAATPRGGCATSSSRRSRTRAVAGTPWSPRPSRPSCASGRCRHSGGSTTSSTSWSRSP